MKNTTFNTFAAICAFGFIGLAFIGISGKFEEVNTALSVFAGFSLFSIAALYFAMNAMQQQMVHMREDTDEVSRRITSEIRDVYQYIEESKRDLHERVESNYRDCNESISEMYRRMDTITDDCCAGSKK